MKETQDLIAFLLRQERTVVFGNLGRRVHVLCKALLQTVPHLEIAVVSPFYPFPALNHRIRVYTSDEDIKGKCELLLYLEPRSHQIIWKHPMAARVAVLASHLNFKTDQVAIGSQWVHACFFHFDDGAVERTQRLLKCQDMPLQARHVQQVDYGSGVNQFILKGYASDIPSTPDLHIVVDLTNYTRDALEMYLKLWDAFDALLERVDFVQRWVVCFPEPNGLRSYQTLTQKCLDRLFCLRIEHGNRTALTDILRVVPYYKSGILDHLAPDNQDVVTSTFGGTRIVIPKTHREACRAAARYDLNPLLKNVFQIKE